MSIPYHLRLEALKDPSFTNWLRLIAGDTWERIKFCRNTEANTVFETTITQNMVYEFLQLELSGSLPVKIYESKKERVNGNDLEFVFLTDYGNLIFPCQCKMLAPNMKYPTLHHEVRGQQQIQLLLDYAKKVNGTPIYLLYNYSPDTIINNQIMEAWKLPIYRFGCSFIDAKYLLREYYAKPTGSFWTIPSFADLHLSNYALPFELLGQFSTEEALYMYARRYARHLNMTGMDIQSFITTDLGIEYWKQVVPPATIGKIELSVSMNRQNSLEPVHEFAPNYRILFNFSINGGQITGKGNLYSIK